MRLFPKSNNDVICLVGNEAGNKAEFRPIGKAEAQAEWNGIPIIKEISEKGYHNPVTPEDLIAALNYFAIDANDVAGLDAIVISGRSPYTDELNSGWAFGAYQVIWEERSQKDQEGKIKRVKVPKENRLIIWGQKIEKVQFNVNGEIREGFYYRVQPVYNGRAVDRYISVRALRREILGDTIVHEIGHHVDIWHYGRFVKSSTDRRKAEKFAESYAELHTRNKVNQAEFESIIEGTYQQATQPQQQPEQQPPTDQQVPQQQIVPGQAGQTVTPQQAAPQAQQAPQITPQS